MIRLYYTRLFFFTRWWYRLTQWVSGKLFTKSRIVQVNEPGDIAKWLSHGTRYKTDAVRGVLDNFTHPGVVQDRVLSGDRIGDCIPIGTPLLRADGVLVPIERIEPGDKIWGKDKWSLVTSTWEKGKLPVTHVRLSNGTTLRLTENHKVYVRECPHHSHWSHQCYCADDLTAERRIKLSELEEGQILLQPKEIAECEDGQSMQQAALAKIIGYFLADGWVDGNRIGISGRDGHPKEAQKNEIARLAKALGYRTSMHPRYIRIYDDRLVALCSQMGSGAPNKHLPNLRFAGDALQAVTEGILADAGTNAKGTRTFRSTSHQLTLQLRILLRMRGIPCGSNYVEKHGGLGKNPVWDLFLRETKKGKARSLRVVSIEREAEYVDCYDIATDDHYVYLPEQDVTVSNCDDHAGYWIAALHRSKLAKRTWFGFVFYTNHQGRTAGHAVALWEDHDGLKWWADYGAPIRWFGQAEWVDSVVNGGLDEGSFLRRRGMGSDPFVYGVMEVLGIESDGALKFGKAEGFVW